MAKRNKELTRKEVEQAVLSLEAQVRDRKQDLQRLEQLRKDYSLMASTLALQHQILTGGIITLELQLRDWRTHLEKLNPPDSVHTEKNTHA